MGINVHALQLLLYRHRRGAKFTRALTLGRQRTNFSERSFRHVTERFAMDPTEQWTRRICDSEFCEPLLEWLGAESVESIDINSYQGASTIHDLNLPLPPSLRGKYSVVLDSGTLEHVFDVPEALRSCVALLEPGGQFLAVSPANNYMGHGFYQFSPELLYRVFDKNGFVDTEAFLTSRASVNGWYRCPNPREARSRIMLSSLEPTFLVFAARKGQGGSVFVTPQQSDYEDIAWIERKAWSGDHSTRATRAVFGLIGTMPGSMRSVAQRLVDVLGAARGLWGRRRFTAFDPARDGREK